MISWFARNSVAANLLMVTIIIGGLFFLSIPLLVAVLWRLGLYGYGFEKSYTPSALESLCQDAGFDVDTASRSTGIPWVRA